jgi:hypothetical protein
MVWSVWSETHSTPYTYTHTHTLYTPHTHTHYTRHTPYLHTHTHIYPHTLHHTHVHRISAPLSNLSMRGKISQIGYIGRYCGHKYCGSGRQPISAHVHVSLSTNIYMYYLNTSYRLPHASIKVRENLLFIFTTRDWFFAFIGFSIILCV